MTSTSAEPTVVRGLARDAVTVTGAPGDLRSGRWTRLGSVGVLGDAATEQTLETLAERTRRAAQAQGYATGWAEGRQAGEAQARVEAEEAERQRADAQQRSNAAQAAAGSALLQAASRLDGAFGAACATVEGRAAELAIALTEAILGREVATAKDPGADAVRRALDLVSAGCAVTVRLHPDDLASLDRSVLGARAVTLAPDAALDRGDAVVETETETVDAALSTALARVREVLSR